jgi:tetratricopeptide (TPR) repeat protein
LVSLSSFAAPFTPSNDAEVVERLPATANDPSVRRVDSLRKQLAARPDDVDLRLEVARRYFDLAMAQGDPRYVGYASAAITPLDKLAPSNAGYWLIKGQLQQYSHDFAGALRSLQKASELDANAPEPVAWRAAIDMVQARYADALGECTRLVPLAHPLYAQGCTAYVQASTGHLRAAYGALTSALSNANDPPAELKLWTRTRLAEMAIRLQRPDEAEAHFKDALALGVTDQFLLGAYADFLLANQRAPEAIKVLADWERSDILLLRLALAGKQAGDSRAKGWTQQLRDRFDAAAQRGDRLHEQEAARFELDVQGQPRKALDYAVRNYTSQKEPRDAEILMRSALAANEPKAAEPAIAWLKANDYEDPEMASLAAQLTQAGAKK